jgi:hypothetical protein
MIRPLILRFFAALSLIPAAFPADKGTKLFEFGFDQRIRNDYSDNIFDYNNAADDQRILIRYRTRAWGQLPLRKDIDLFVGLTQETTQIIVKRAPYRFDEVAFDNLYLDFKKVFADGLSLRVGRQNLMRGEGFVIYDGNSGDGSRSFYFNAFNLAYSHKHSKIELIGILDPQKEQYLPKIHNRSRQLTEWNEQALGGYYTDNNLKSTSLEAYYFYKKETGDRRPVTNLQFQPDRHIHTLGGRVVQKLNYGWEATGEIAFQWGAQHPATNIAGRGGYAYLKKKWQSKWQPSVSLGYWGISGDNPSTINKNEGWDPLFSRWPKYSDLHISSTLVERGAGYWTNLGMWQTELLFNPTKHIGGRLTYYWMDSYHPYPGNSNIFATGTGRGNLYQIRMDINANKYWKGDVVLERQLPGDFYTHRSGGYFLRFELNFLFKGSLSM